MPLTSKGTEIKSSMEKEYGKEKGEKVFYASANKGTISGVDSMGGRRRFSAAVRDAIAKGVPTRDAIAQATKDAEEQPRDEGGKFTGHAMGKGGKTLHTTSGHHSHEAAAKAAIEAKPNAKSVSTGHGYNGSFGIRFHRPDQAKSYSKDTEINPAIEGTKQVVNNTVKGVKTLVGDKKRFLKQFRDAVRENQPLAKCIELGVISGVDGIKSGQESAARSVSTEDAKLFRDTVAKGIPIGDALKLMTKDYGVKGMKKGVQKPGMSWGENREEAHNRLTGSGYKHVVTAASKHAPGGQEQKYQHPKGGKASILHTGPGTKAKVMFGAS